MVSTSETYNSGFGTTESNPLFRQSQSFASMSQYASSPEAKPDNSVSQLALPPLRTRADAGRMERGPSDDPSSMSHSSAGYSPYQAYPETYKDEAEQPILPPNFIQPEPAYVQPSNYGYAEPESQTRPRQRQPSHGRGVSLVDTGPVPVGGQQAPHDPVRRVSRHARRSSSRNHLVSPVSGNSHSSQLPPGAVSTS
jgi:chitin synthase